jgi:serine/threonine-protein kinase
MSKRPPPDTFLLPRKTQARTAGGADAARRPGPSPDLLAASRSRLRILAWTYAGLFAVATLVPALLEGDGARVFEAPIQWAPGAIAVGLALLTGVVASVRRIPDGPVVDLGLVWQVAACAAIAFVQYWGVGRAFATAAGDWGGYGLSWAVPWALAFAVLVPSTPLKSTLSAALSLAAPPALLALSIYQGATPFAPSDMEFFLAAVLPNLLALGAAFAVSSVVCGLGADVARAKELGSYRLLERLGGEGISDVWKASHRLLDQPIAIKRVRAESIGELDTEQGRTLAERFEREARIAADLSSPHTAKLLDHGMTIEGDFYYVTELLKGFDLEQMVDRFGPMPPARAISILAQACDSLAEAHHRGLVHRDIRPAKLVLCRGGARFDFVKVLDFGLVKRDHSSAGLEARLARTDVILGAPAYLPPEMARGGAADSRTDLYAMGCVGYWLVTGALVFEGPSQFDIVSQHMRERPVPPSRRSSRPIPHELDQIIMACLEKDPDRRPASARELARRLDAIVMNEYWSADRAEAWWKEHLAQSPADEGEAPRAISAGQAP